MEIKDLKLDETISISTPFLQSLCMEHIVIVAQKRGETQIYHSIHFFQSITQKFCNLSNGQWSKYLIIVTELQYLLRRSRRNVCTGLYVAQSRGQRIYEGRVSKEKFKGLAVPKAPWPVNIGDQSPCPQRSFRGAPCGVKVSKPMLYKNTRIFS